MSAAAKNQVNMMFRAFSDRTRLRILYLLREDELCVGDLLAILRAPQPTVSRHLTYLRKAGLVRRRKEGRWFFYTLAPRRTCFHRKLIDCLGSCFQDVPELSRDLKQARKMMKAGGCCLH